jgi:hypothetical protein
MRYAALVDTRGNPVKMPKPGEELKRLDPVLSVYPDLVAWHDARTLTIGGSDAPAVFGAASKSFSRQALQSQGRTH